MKKKREAQKKGEAKLVLALRDLNFESKDQLIKTWTLDEVLLIKAEVIKVKGIICVENVSGRDGDVQIKQVSEVEWKKLG